MAEALVEHTKNYFRTHQGTVDPIIDSDVIQKVIVQMEEACANANGNGEDAFQSAQKMVDTLDLGDGTQIYNVMKDLVPYEFSRARKEYVPCSQGAHLFPGVNSKTKIYTERFHILWQRLLLQGTYVPEFDAAGGNVLPGQRVITPVESLVGNLGKKLTFGLISSVQEDSSKGRRWVIEDLHRTCPIDFDESTYSEWDYQLVTDGSFVLAEGEMRMGTFHVSRIDVPEAITRLMSDERDEVPVQVFGGDITQEQVNILRNAELDNPEGMYVVLSEVYLDSVRNWERLEKIFQGYEESRPPIAYIFMGSFCSTPFLPTAESVRTYREGFERLQLMMRDIPNHKTRGTRFIFIPGPKDPGAQRLPRAPLTDYLTANIAKDNPNVILATNPCRIRHFSRELVFFRHDVLKLLRRHEVVPMSDPTEPGAPSPQHVRNQMARLLLDQAHLAPLPLQESNILWDFDHTLRLYPLPDAVFVGGVGQQFDTNYKECDFLSVGPFYNDTFYGYSPIEEVDGTKVQWCDVPASAG
jgi:DNA polymerase epsilon subunit 2